MNDQKYLRKGDLRKMLIGIVNEQGLYTNPYDKEKKAKIVTKLEAIMSTAVEQAIRGDRHARRDVLEFLEGKPGVSNVADNGSDNPYDGYTKEEIEKLMKERNLSIVGGSNDNRTGRSLPGPGADSNNPPTDAHATG